MTTSTFELGTITKNPITKSVSSVILTICVAVLFVVAAYVFLLTTLEPSTPLDECDTVKKDRENSNDWFTLLGIGSVLFAGVACFALWHGSSSGVSNVGTHPVVNNQSTSTVTTTQPNASVITTQPTATVVTTHSAATAVTTLPTDPVNFPPSTASSPPNTPFILMLCEQYAIKLGCTEYDIEFDDPTSLKVELSRIGAIRRQEKPSIFCRNNNRIYLKFVPGDWRPTFDGDINSLSDCTAEQLNEFVNAEMFPTILPGHLQTVACMLNNPSEDDHIVACRHTYGLTCCDNLTPWSQGLQGINETMKAYAKVDPNNQQTPVSLCKYGNAYFVVFAKGTAIFELKGVPGACNKKAIEKWLEERMKENDLILAEIDDSD